MRVVLPFVFEQLKQEVLDKAGLKIITPSDCQPLSFQISKTTKKQISDTTIKRIYGFAITNSVPSLYTLNLLSEFCGFASWDAFSNRQNKAPQPSAAVPGTQNVYEILRRTTLNTLHALKNKSVIPFNLTLDREGINQHLDEFVAGSCRATVLSSPAGYGKTIGLCRWVERQLNNTLILNNDDTILFLNNKVLSSISQGTTLTDWLLALMGLPVGNGLDTLANVGGLMYSKFYLIIDEFDGNTTKPDQLELLFSMVLDFLAISSDWPGFKLILTMRSASWGSCNRRLILDNRIHEWHLGIMDQGNKDQNVPLFTSNEIKELSRRINPAIKMPDVLHAEISSFFSYPLFFQYYYQKNHTDFLLDELDHFRIYEVISSYIFDKVYAGKHTTEKVLLLRALLDAGQFKNSRFLIDKLKAYEHLKNYKDAYNDLISIGFLRDVSFTEETVYEEYIEFTNKRLFTAVMAAKLIHDCDSYSDELCLKLSDQIVPPYRVYVLKWCIFNSVKTKQYEIFNHVEKISLDASEKAILLSFLSSLIKQNFLLPTGMKAEELFFANHDHAIFSYFFGFEFISLGYEQGLRDLLKLDLSEKTQIWVNVCLSIIYLVQLDSEALENSIKVLRSFSEEGFAGFQINPLHCIETIYSYTKYGIVPKKALVQITRFLFNGPTAKTQAGPGSNNVLNLLALVTQRLAANNRKTLRLIKKLKQVYEETAIADPAYFFFLQTTYVNVLLAMGETDAALEIYNELAITYKANQASYTRYMKIVFEMISVIMSGYGQAINYSITAIENIAYNQDKTGYKLIEINTLSHYLELQNFDRSTDLNKAAYLKFRKYIYSTGFSPQSFLFNYQNIKEHIIA